MGGAKKPTAASKDKASGSRDSKKKKDKGDGSGGPKKAEITVLVNSKQAMRIIENSKVITVQDLARQIGVKISAANAFLRESANNGVIKRVGGYSGHYLYRMATSEESDLSLESKSNPQSESVAEEGEKEEESVTVPTTAAETS